MPQISTFYGIIIWMYYRDHNPPHFHDKYGDHEVLIEIGNLSIFAGNLPARALGLVIEWASLHQEELLKNWTFSKEEKPLIKIEPLK